MLAFRHLLLWCCVLAGTVAGFRIRTGGSQLLKKAALASQGRHRNQNGTKSPEAVDIHSAFDLHYEKGKINANLQYSATAPLGGVLASALRADATKIDQDFVAQVNAKYPREQGFLTVFNDGDGSPQSWVAAKDIALQRFDLDLVVSRKVGDEDTHVKFGLTTAARVGALACGTRMHAGHMSQDYCSTFSGSTMILAQAGLSGDLILQKSGDVGSDWTRVQLEISKSPSRVYLNKNKFGAKIPLHPTLAHFSNEKRYKYIDMAQKAGGKKEEDLMKALIAWEASHSDKYVFATEKMFYAFALFGATMDASMSITRGSGRDPGFHIHVEASMSVTVWDFKQSEGDYKMRLISSSSDYDMEECRRDGKPALRCFHITFRLVSGFHLDHSGRSSGYTFSISDIEIPTATWYAASSAKKEVNSELSSSMGEVFPEMFTQLAQVTLAQHKRFRGDSIELAIEVRTDINDEEHPISVTSTLLHDEDVFQISSDKVKPLVKMLNTELPAGPWSIHAPMTATLMGDLRLKFSATVKTNWEHEAIINLSELAALLDVMKALVLNSEYL